MHVVTLCRKAAVRFPVCTWQRLLCRTSVSPWNNLVGFKSRLLSQTGAFRVLSPGPARCLCTNVEDSSTQLGKKARERTESESNKGKSRLNPSPRSRHGSRDRAPSALEKDTTSLRSALREKRLTRDVTNTEKRTSGRGGDLKSRGKSGWWHREGKPPLKGSVQRGEKAIRSRTIERDGVTIQETIAVKRRKRDKMSDLSPEEKEEQKRMEEMSITRQRRYLHKLRQVRFERERRLAYMASEGLTATALAVREQEGEALPYMDVVQESPAFQMWLAEKQKKKFEVVMPEPAPSVNWRAIGQLEAGMLVVGFWL